MKCPTERAPFYASNTANICCKCIPTFLQDPLRNLERCPNFSLLVPSRFSFLLLFHHSTSVDQLSPLYSFSCLGENYDRFRIVYFFHSYDPRYILIFPFVPVPLLGLRHFPHLLFRVAWISLLISFILDKPNGGKERCSRLWRRFDR